MHAIYAYRPWDPTTYPAGIEARAPDILAAWLRRFPDAVPTHRDPEDWIESATILHSADAMGLPLTLLESQGDGMLVSGSGWMHPVARPGAPLGAMLGQWAKSDFMRGLPIDMDPVGSTGRSTRIAEGYASSDTFRRHAGRPIALARGDRDGEGGLEEALRAVVGASGAREVFIKTVQKGWSRRLAVDPSSPKGLWDQISDADMALERDYDDRALGLGWIPVRHEGSTVPILLIQGVIRPTFEYRIVVIDGRPVTASGCIEAFTPAENTAVFDPQMEEVRSNGDVVVRPDLVERYLAFAETFCAEFAAEHGDGLDYGLDVCIDAATGTVVPIELNGCLNLGAYARSTDAWLSAIVERAERLAIASQEKTA